MVEENKNLQSLHTFGVPWQSRFFCSVRDSEEVVRVVKYCIEHQTEIFILGGGSNLLPTRDWGGVVIRNEIAGRQVIDQDQCQITLSIGSGENWHDLVTWSVEHGYYGLENLVLIPGTVGGAVVQNIGAYNVDLQRYVVSVEAIDMQTGELRNFNREECRFEYRNSLFKNNPGTWMVVSVDLVLSKTFEPVTTYKPLQDKFGNRVPKLTANEVMQTVIEIRQLKLPDPTVVGTAGSFFGNPRISDKEVSKLQNDNLDMPVFDNYGTGKNTVPAGWLIEHADIDQNLKDRFLYPKHHLVVVNNDKNTDQTSGEEILQFTRLAQRQVSAKFGIELVPEVVIL